MSGALGSVTLNLDVDLSRFEAGIRRAKVDVDALIDTVNKRKISLDVDTSSVTKGLDNIRASSTGAGAGLDGIGAKGRNAFGAVAGAMAPIPLGLAGIGVGIGALGASMFKFGADSLQTFLGFEEGMNQVFTLLPDISGAAMDTMSQQALDFGAEFGMLSTEVVPALYEALSSGVPQENVFSFLEVAAKGAIAGGTDVMTMVNGLTSVVNAYGIEALSAERASDIFFATVNIGKVTAEQLAKTLYDVVPAASSLGIGLDQVGVGIATLTAQGTPARVATTQLRQMFLELGKEGTKVDGIFRQIAGVAFRDFIAAGGTVGQAMAMLQQHAVDTGINVNEMFTSVEAGQAAWGIAATEGAEIYATASSAMLDSTGATTAGYERMQQSGERAFDKLGAAWERLKIEFGESIAPTAIEWAEKLTAAMPGLTEDAVAFGEAFAAFAERHGPGAADAMLDIVAAGKQLVAIGVQVKDFGAFVNDFFKPLSDSMNAIVAAGPALREVFTGPEPTQIAGVTDYVAAIKMVADAGAAMSDLPAAYDAAAAAASKHLGITVSATDAQRGYIIAADGTAHSLESYVQAALLATNGSLAYATSLDELRAKGHAASVAQAEVAQGVTTAGTAMADAAASGFADWLGTRIPAAGEAALDQMELVGQGVTAGMVTAEQAVDAFVQNGEIGFTEFIESARGNWESLSDQLAAAQLVPPTEESAAQIAGLTAAMAAYEAIIAEATGRANEFAAAQQNWNAVQGALDQGVQTASANQQEWQSDISESGKALDILNAKKESGIELTAEETRQYDNLTWMQERATGGLEDQNSAYVSAVDAKATFMRLQDDITAKYPDLVHGSDEWKAALTEAGLAAGMSEGQIAGLIGGAEGLEGSIADLVTAINGLLVGLGLIPAETPMEIVADTTNAEEGIGTVQEGFTEFEGSEASGTLSTDNELALRGTEAAKESADDFAAAEYTALLEADPEIAMTATSEAGNMAVSFAEQQYMAQIEADAEVAKRETAEAQTDADTFVNGGPYAADLNVNDNASGPISSAQSAVNTLVGGTYTVRITADISDLEAGVVAAGSLLPHSPADRGPLAYQPTWDYAFEGAPLAAERYVKQAADTAAKYLPVGGVVRDGPLDDPAEWDFLFADLDRAAEDYGKRSADAFIGFFAGNLEAIANGQAMYDAQQALEESLMIRQIAVDQNMGPEVIAQIDAQIAAQRAAIEQIGEVVGSGIVDGLIDEVAQFDIAAALQLPDGGSPWSLDDIVSGDALAGAEAAIAEMQQLLAIAMEAGDAELIDLYTAQLAELQRQLAVLHEILGTQTVQDLQDTAAAAQAAADAAAILLDRFMQMGTDPVAAVTAANTAVEELRKALELAILTPGTPMDVINDLLAAYEAAQDDAAQMAIDAAKMFQAGLIDTDELFAMADAGGQAFIDGFNEAMGDPDAYDDLVQAHQDALALIRQHTIDELRAMIPDMEDGGVSLIGALIEGVIDGTTDFEDALAVLGDIALANGQGLEETLGALLLSLQNDLQQAMAAGTDTTIISQNIEVIRQLLASLGLEIDDVLKAAQDAAKAASATAKSTNKGIQGGGGAGGRNYALPGYEPGGRGGGSPTKPVDDAIEQMMVNFDALRLAIAEMQDGGVSIIDTLVESTAKGAAKYDDLLGTLAGMTQSHAAETKETLADLYASTAAALAQAQAAATDPKSITLYKNQMAIVKRIIADMGWSVDDLVARAEAAQAALMSATGGSGSGASTSFAPPTIVNNFNPRIAPNMYLDGEKITTNVSNNLYRKAGMGN